MAYSIGKGLAYIITLYNITSLDPFQQSIKHTEKANIFIN